jgi:hypothetical protein
MQEMLWHPWNLHFEISQISNCHKQGTSESRSTVVHLTLPYWQASTELQIWKKWRRWGTNSKYLADNKYSNL